MNILSFIHKFCFCDNVETPITESLTYPSGVTVYEVVRIIDTKPLFAEDHLVRMLGSLNLTNIYYPIDAGVFRNQIQRLCQINNVTNGNVEYLLVKKADGRVVTYMGFIQHHYPEPQLYIDGVDLAGLHSERDNPQAKVKNTLTRQRANKRIAETGAYEMVLINQQGLVTEGSRSNLFFVKDDSIVTAPDNMVLSGITRKHVLQVIDFNDINIVRQPIRYSRINTFDAAFMCGTSPEVIPIHSIDKVKYQTDNKLVKTIMDGYNQQVTNYLMSH